MYTGELNFFVIYYVLYSKFLLLFIFIKVISIVNDELYRYFFGNIIIHIMTECIAYFSLGLNFFMAPVLAVYFAS
jgi:hypothetical protein